jgi:hypothetical protein
LLNIKVDKQLSASTSVISRLSKQTKKSGKQLTINENPISNEKQRLQMASMSEIFDMKSETGTDYDVLQSSFISNDMKLGFFLGVYYS